MQKSVKALARETWLVLSFIRLIPHIVLMKYHPVSEVMRLDLKRWWAESSLKTRMEPGTSLSDTYIFVALMTDYPEFRSLFYHRLGWVGKVLRVLCPPLPTLYIYTKDIGPGLFIQHGFSTIISAKKIGHNCSINQQVTIGYTNNTDCPTIGNNVSIYAGAKVIGNVRLGDNSVVGANAVVVKDVPENCTVVGVPAYIVRRNGVKVKESL